MTVARLTGWAKRFALDVFLGLVVLFASLVIVLHVRAWNGHPVLTPDQLALPKPVPISIALPFHGFLVPLFLVDIANAPQRIAEWGIQGWGRKPFSLFENCWHWAIPALLAFWGEVARLLARRVGRLMRPIDHALQPSPSTWTMLGGVRLARKLTPWLIGVAGALTILLAGTLTY